MRKIKPPEINPGFCSRLRPLCSLSDDDERALADQRHDMRRPHIQSGFPLGAVIGVIVAARHARLVAADVVYDGLDNVRSHALSGGRRA